MKKLLPHLLLALLVVGYSQEYKDCAGEIGKNVELWGICYSIKNTTEIALFKRGATGDFTTVVGEIPESIGNLINLKELALDGNKLTGRIPESIGNLTNLISLNLERNRLTGEIPKSIGNLTELTYLGLSNNQLSGEIPDNINNLKNLAGISLWDNQLNGVISESICNLAEHFDKKLKWLNLVDLPLPLLNGQSSEEEIIKYISEPSIFISNNNFCQPYPECFNPIDIGNQYPDKECTFKCKEGYVELWGWCYSIENTTSLDLSYKVLIKEIPSKIGSLINLTYLNLESNKLTGEIPKSIGNLTELTYLGLSNNQLSGEIPSEIWHLDNLTHLDLHKNKFTGKIPSKINKLQNLIHLNLQNNKFSGKIPSAIGDLKNLNYLSLWLNQLEGEIPTEIWNLRQLTFLGLRSNMFSDLISNSICNLELDFTDNSKFNINRNRLCPPYPDCIEKYMGKQDISECEYCIANPDAPDCN